MYKSKDLKYLKFFICWGQKREKWRLLVNIDYFFIGEQRKCRIVYNDKEL